MRSDLLSARQKTWLVILAVMLCLAMGAFMTVMTWNRALKRKVGIKTRELQNELNERLKAEAEIERGKKEWETTFDAMSDWICLVDTDKRILRSNRAGEKILNLSLKDIIGKNCCELVHEKGESIPGCPIDKMVASQQREMCEYYDNYHKKWLFITAEPVFDEGGNIKCAIHVLQDVSEQKSLEDRLMQAQKMESIGTLAGGIAHDFNNILAIIVGNTEMTIEDLPEGHPAKENLREILNAGLRARDVVRHILSFSRKAVTDRKPIHLYPVVEDTLKMLRASIPTHIEIRQNMSCESDVIMADPTQMSQVLMNICTNAAQAMREEGGVLVVGLQNVEFEIQTGESGIGPGRYVKLSVSDTGTGIEPEHIDRIFEPYFTTREPGAGTGLGLSVVQGIVKTHHGLVTVASDFGKGTVFEVLLPVIEGEAEPEAEETGTFPTGNEKILVVDDEASILKLVKRKLEIQGYKVEAREDPADALELVRSGPDRFDLIITDMTMPKMTGDKLAREVFKIRPDMPVIL